MVEKNKSTKEIEEAFVNLHFLKRYVKNKNLQKNIKQNILKFVEDSYVDLENVILDLDMNPTEIIREAEIESKVIK